MNNCRIKILISYKSKLLNGSVCWCHCRDTERCNIEHPPGKVPLLAMNPAMSTGLLSMCRSFMQPINSLVPNRKFSGRLGTPPRNNGPVRSKDLWEKQYRKRMRVMLNVLSNMCKWTYKCVGVSLCKLTSCCWSVSPVQHSYSCRAECQTSEKRPYHSHLHSRQRPSHRMDPGPHRSHFALARYIHKCFLISTQTQSTQLHEYMETMGSKVP